MANPPKIRNAGSQLESVIILWREYQCLAALEDDVVLTDEERRDLAVAENDEFFPYSVVKRLSEGEHPVQVFRAYRKLTRKQLAAQAGISVCCLSQIEWGRSTGSGRILTALARALDVDADLLMEVA